MRPEVSDFNSKMFNLIFCLLALSMVRRSSQYVAVDATLERLERTLKQADPAENEIGEPDSNRIKKPVEASLFHREPDFAFNARQMIEYRGFKFEPHHVVTEDCYVLEMHRIVNPLDRTPNKPPVLLQHGLIDSRFLHCSSAVVSLNLALQ